MRCIRLKLTRISRNRIAEHRRARHLVLYPVIIALLVLPMAIAGQVRLTEEDLKETAGFYKSLNKNNGIKTFQSKMPAPVKDEKTRRAIMENLPEAILKLKVENAEISANVKKLFAPVLMLYGRQDVYEIIVFKHPTPIMMSDSGMAIVVSTGLINRATSDDELLGYLAHEVAHEYYAQYSVYTRYLTKMVTEKGRETALNRKYIEALAIIELQCDAFAALTLGTLEYNSVSFIVGLEAAGRDFPNHSYGSHPPDEQRRKLIEQIASKTNLSIKTRTSNELTALKVLISKLK